MKHTINFGERNINFMLYPSLNLVAHTSNLLGLSLGGRGAKRYHLRDNSAAIKSIEGSPKVRQEFFYSIMRGLILNDVEDSEKAISLIGVYSNTSAGILRRSWDCFYKTYWEQNKTRLENYFNQMIRNRDWSKTFNEMQDITDVRFPMDFYVAAVEATAASATMIPPNISIGTPQPQDDCGFVHEGLHLLLDHSPEYKQVASFMNAHKFPEEQRKTIPYRDFKGKIEQAAVITLDSLISGRPEYLDGCRVGDLRDTVYCELVKWYNSERKVKFTEALLDILKVNEEKIFGGKIR